MQRKPELWRKLKLPPLPSICPWWLNSPCTVASPWKRKTPPWLSCVPLSEANRWARVFEQAGYVWIDRDEPASLRVRTLRNTWIEEADLD